MWAQMSFAAAADNLVAGARHGLEAKVFWPGFGEVAVTELVLRRLLPQASRDCAGGACGKRRDRMLGVIEQRCLAGGPARPGRSRGRRLEGGLADGAMRCAG